MDNYGTVDNPAWITTVFCALMNVSVDFSCSCICACTEENLETGLRLIALK